MISPELRRLAAAIAHIDGRAPHVTRILPIDLRGRTNGSQGVTSGGRYARAKTHRSQRQIARLALLPELSRCFSDRSPLDLWGWTGAVVRITRVSPRRLDGDNATAAAKSVRDGVADALGVDDRDPRVEWLVDQEAGPASVWVEIYRWDRPDDAPAPQIRTKSARPTSRSVPTPNVVRRGTGYV